MIAHVISLAALRRTPCRSTIYVLALFILPTFQIAIASSHENETREAVRTRLIGKQFWVRSFLWINDDPSDTVPKNFVYWNSNQGHPFPLQPDVKGYPVGTLLHCTDAVVNSRGISLTLSSQPENGIAKVVIVLPNGWEKKQNAEANAILPIYQVLIPRTLDRGKVDAAVDEARYGDKSLAIPLLEAFVTDFPYTSESATAAFELGCIYKERYTAQSADVSIKRPPNPVDSAWEAAQWFERTILEDMNGPHAEESRREIATLSRILVDEDAERAIAMVDRVGNHEKAAQLRQHVAEQARHRPRMGQSYMRFRSRRTEISLSLGQRVSLKKGGKSGCDVRRVCG